mgnify:CR=1 FL=1
MNQPFSQACENNKTPVFDVLKQYLAGDEYILEIGSGTGQHARYFADNLPNILWQTSDLQANHSGIEAWIKDCEHKNIASPLNLNVADKETWPDFRYDAIFTANTMHIMSWQEVTVMFNLVAACLKEKGVFFSYGPFNRDGKFTSASNEAFDYSLRWQDSKMGIRDLNDIQKEAEQNQMALSQIHAMPANNMLLVFTKDKP